MKNLIYLLIAGITLTSCVKKSDFAEYQLEQEQRVNALESRQKDLEHELEVLQLTINSEVERLELVISVVDAENDAELLAGLQNANDELKLAVEQLEDADTSNLTVALNAIASAEERLTDVIVDNLESVTEALNELTDVDENLQAQIDLLLNDVNTLSTSLQQETVDIYEAIQNAIRVVEVTRVVMQDSTVGQGSDGGQDEGDDESTPSTTSTPTVILGGAEVYAETSTNTTETSSGTTMTTTNTTIRLVSPDWGDFATFGNDLPNQNGGPRWKSSVAVPSSYGFTGTGDTTTGRIWWNPSLMIWIEDVTGLRWEAGTYSTTKNFRPEKENTQSFGSFREARDYIVNNLLNN